MAYLTAKSDTFDPAGQQLDFASVILGPRTEACTTYLNLSDSELEHWFSCHRSELVNLLSLDIAPIAAWLPTIGPPANDNASIRDC